VSFFLQNAPNVPDPLTVMAKEREGKKKKFIYDGKGKRGKGKKKEGKGKRRRTRRERSDVLGEIFLTIGRGRLTDLKCLFKFVHSQIANHICL